MEPDTGAAITVEEQEEARRFISPVAYSQSRENDAGKHDDIRIYTEESALLPKRSDETTEAEHGESLSWWKRPSVFWLLPALSLFTISWGGTVVPRINLILVRVCSDYLSEQHTKNPAFTYAPVIFGEKNPQCRIPEVQSLVARFQLILNLLTGSLAAIASPKLGALSDGYGRLKMLAFTVLGVMLNDVIALLVAATPMIPANLLMLGAVFDGIFGSAVGALALSNSYAADCTAPERRNVTFGYLYGALFIGSAVGPMLAGILIKMTSVIYVFLMGACFHVAFLFLVVFIIPESLPKSRQRQNRLTDGLHFKRSVTSMSWSSFNPIKLLAPLSILYPHASSHLGPHGRHVMRSIRTNLLILASVDTVVSAVNLGASSIIVIYAEYMFGWGNFESSMFISINSSVRVVLLLIILPCLTRVFRGPAQTRSNFNTGCDKLDLYLIRVSMLLTVMAYIGYSTDRSGLLFYVCGAAAATGTMVVPSLQSSLTKHVPENRTGQLLGAVALLHSLTRVVAPVILNLIYSATVRALPQMIFICLTAALSIALLLSFFIKSHVYLHESTEAAGDGEAEDGDLVPDEE